ncbi:MAG: CDP-glycerol glycerophosphotransferase family protein [Verrucomicrobia bacterium]|nr:CDP-glycerol glycerophosphotransferase family protein [Verrucomicrobiota bacterium]
MKYAALNTGPDIHLLDHIAPLAEQFKAPLFIEEEKNIDLARRYYPQLEIRSFDVLHLESLLEFDVLLECKKWAPHLKQLFLDFYRKNMRLVFCPHGFSDKITPLASYASQDAVLIYGDLHLEMLGKLGIEPNIWAVTGNYRFDFYRRYKSFYDHIANQEIFSNLKPQPTLLYAPTWADAEGGSSFFDWGPSLIDQLPSSWNLIVKVHPLLEIQQPSRYYSLAAKIENKENTALVSEFPPVYPILSRVDAYLGDTSSIGYDFLIFDKPLFFLDSPHVKPGPLRQCGTTLSKFKNIFRQIEDENTNFSKERKSLLQKAFHTTLKS